MNRRMVSRFRSMAVGFTAGAVMNTAWGGCARVTRTVEYRAAIESFHRAIQREHVVERNQSAVWDFQLKVPGTDVIAEVRARNSPGVVTIKYSDETADRPLYRYVDYSIPVAIRTAGPVLYVYWVENLIGSHSWLLAYDWENRRELHRWRVDPDDMLK